MINGKIYSLASNYRKRIVQARQKGYFMNGKFEKFPYQCCGDTSSLLAEYLRENGVETLLVSGTESNTYETHAWLVVLDEQIHSPRRNFDGVPDGIIDIFASYGGSIVESMCYSECDIENGVIVDITGDQFGEEPVYVGDLDEFHKWFDQIKIYEHEGLFSDELIKLYEII